MENIGNKERNIIMIFRPVSVYKKKFILLKF